jgi:hypothetical protein
MVMDKDIDLFDRLLYEEASDVLIFRPHEYTFDGALVLEKGELLRDIVSAANAWRRTDTYILVGVKEVKGGKNKIQGLIEHLNEKRIIDFVNSKLQTPITFSYRALTMDRKQVGMIHIPLQKRPFYLNENYANLKKYVIYVRHGDTVREADIEEAAQIKECDLDQGKPDISFQVEFAHAEKGKALGDYLNLKTFSIGIPPLDSLPDFDFKTNVGPADHGYAFGIPPRSNRHFYRELVVHLQRIGAVSQIDFCITNTGSETARDVQLEINIEDPEKELFCLEEFEIPHRPDKDAGQSSIKPLFTPISDNMRVKWRSPFWMIQLRFREIPAGKTVFSNSGLYIGGTSNVKLDMVVLLKTRDLSQQLHFPLIIDIKTQKRQLDRDIICKSI